MAWSYSGDPKNSPRDRVRFELGDTSAADVMLQDGEIDFLLEEHGGRELAAALAGCDAIMAKLSKEADFSAGATSVSASQRREHYRQLSATLRARLAGRRPAIRLGCSSGPRFRRGDDSNGRR